MNLAIAFSHPSTCAVPNVIPPSPVLSPIALTIQNLLPVPATVPADVSSIILKPTAAFLEPPSCLNRMAGLSFSPDNSVFVVSASNVKVASPPEIFFISKVSFIVVEPPVMDSALVEPNLKSNSSPWLSKYAPSPIPFTSPIINRPSSLMLKRVEPLFVNLTKSL